MNINLVVIVLVGLGVLFFVSAVAAFLWAIRTRQFEKLEKGATVIFDAEEPEGSQTDFFPASKSAPKATSPKNETKNSTPNS